MNNITTEREVLKRKYESFFHKINYAIGKAAEYVANKLVIHFDTVNDEVIKISFAKDSRYSKWCF